MSVDWNAVRDETARHLSALIRFDTTNPPGNERPAADYVAAALRGAGLEPQVLEPRDNRASVLVRLRSPNATERPLLLMAHLDVVPAEPAQWTHPPFAGEIHDGYVWGRGAVDSKNTVSIFLVALLVVARQEWALNRDLIFAATADEEMGGVNGIEWLVENYPELLDAEYALNEGGGFTIRIGDRQVTVVQTAEKGASDIDLVAHGTPGHSSIPHDDNPIYHLAGTIGRLAEQPMPHSPTPTVRRFFETLAQEHPDPAVSQACRDALDAGKCAEALASLPCDESVRLMLDAMLRNTAAPTMLEAGTKRNVIPSQATARLSGRALPGYDMDGFMAELRPLIGEKVEIVQGNFRAGQEVAADTPLFDAIARVMKREDPESIVAPYMITGGTDARFLVPQGMIVYGFLPMRSESGVSMMELAHAHDERISLDNLEYGVRLTCAVIREFCAD